MGKAADLLSSIENPSFKDSDEYLLIKLVKKYESFTPIMREACINDLVKFAKDLPKTFISNLCVKARQLEMKNSCFALLLSLIHRSEDEQGPKVKNVFHEVMYHPQDMLDFMSVYMKSPIKRRSKQMEKGLSKCFLKFTEAQFKSCSRKGPWKLRDVMYISHPKPLNEEQAQLFNKIARNRL